MAGYLQHLLEFMQLLLLREQRYEMLSSNIPKWGFLERVENMETIWKENDSMKV